MTKATPFEIKAFTTTFNGMSKKLINEITVCSQNGCYTAKALWDTGATHTAIAMEVAGDMDLIPVGMCNVQTPSGNKTFPTYCVDLILPNHVVIKDVQVVGSEIGKQGLGLLVGMDIIALGDFAVSNHSGKTQFTFRVPSCSDASFIDNARDGFKGIPIAKPKTPERNGLCPCGSGKKYKMCCGK